MTICLKTIAAEITGKFEKLIAEDPPLKTAVAYYTDRPPKRQVWEDGGPSWVEITHTEPATHRLLVQLAQARNNLFHGGKGWKPEGEADRDNKIVEHGILILEAVVKSSEAMSEEFSSYA